MTVNGLAKILMAATLAGLTAGCGGEGRLPIHAVEGTLTVRDKGVEGAEVVFHPVSGDPRREKLRPNGRSDEGGVFKLTTYLPGDGAPEGEYVVTVTRPRPDGKSPDPEFQFSGEDEFQGRFADPKTSRLRVHVSPGENRLGPFDLSR